MSHSEGLGPSSDRQQGRHPVYAPCAGLSNGRYSLAMAPLTDDSVRSFPRTSIVWNRGGATL